MATARVATIPQKTMNKNSFEQNKILSTVLIQNR